MLLVATLALCVTAEALRTRQPHLSITDNLHLGLGISSGVVGRVVFFNNLHYGPYTGMLLSHHGDSDDEDDARFDGSKSSYGICHRSFQWPDETVWTLAISLWWPLAAFALLPTSWGCLHAFSRCRWYQFSLMTLLALTTLTAAALGIARYANLTRPMREQHSDLLQDCCLFGEEKELYLHLVWDRKTWESGLIAYVFPDKSSVLPGRAHVVWSAAITEGGMRRHVFLLWRRFGTDGSDCACVVTGDRYGFRLWRRLEELPWQDLPEFEEAAILSGPWPVMEVTSSLPGACRYEIRPDSIAFLEVRIPQSHIDRFACTDSHWLYLNQPGVTDATLADLNRLANLKTLSIESPHITDVGLDHLRTLKHLELLRLDDCKATANGVERLRKALPDCEILTRVPGATGTPDDSPN